MTVKAKGNLGIQLIKVERNWNQTTGWSSIYTYGGSWANIEAAKTNSLFINYATNIEAVKDKNLGELRVTFANLDNAQPDQNIEDSNTWTFQPYTIQRNIHEHPRYVGLADIASEKGFLQRILLAVDTYKDKVATGIAAQTADKDLVFALEDYIEYRNANNSNITAANEALALELAGLLLRGHDTYDVTKYTITNVKVVPPTTNITVDHYKTGHQWSTLRLANLINAGTPSVTQAAIIGDVINTFLTDKWLKQAPRISERTDKKFEIVTEWVNVSDDELPTQIYPNFL